MCLCGPEARDTSRRSDWRTMGRRSLDLGLNSAVPRPDLVSLRPGWTWPSIGKAVGPWFEPAVPSATAKTWGQRCELIGRAGACHSFLGSPVRTRPVYVNNYSVAPSTIHVGTEEGGELHTPGHASCTHLLSPAVHWKRRLFQYLTVAYGSAFHTVKTCDLVLPSAMARRLDLHIGFWIEAPR